MKYIIFILQLFIAFQSGAQIFVDPPVSPGNCMRDANDPKVSDSREDIKRAVFKYTIQIGSHAYNCTGTLINRNTNENDLGQFFITSWHCFHDGSTNADLSGVPLTFYFNYQSPPDHLGQVLEPNKTGSIYSMTRYVRLVDRVSSDYGDVAICEILGAPIPPHFNPYFVGWTPAKPPAVNSFVTFGHSSGSLKQVAGTNYVQDGLTGNIQTQTCQTVTKVVDFLLGWIWKHRSSTSVVCQYLQIPFADSRYVVYGYTYGNTAEGASGSGIFEK